MSSSLSTAESFSRTLGSVASTVTSAMLSSSAPTRAFTQPTLDSSSLSSSSSPSPTGSSGGGSSSSAAQNSPLLFFVALGFGVVFTNLWIIVGVKYCFRYNARARARANGVDDVDLQAMGGRPHRRRREKKLMTVDEVNERFPVTKYKTWRANREVMGLSTAGGIAPTDATAPSNEQTQTAAEPPASPLPKLPEPVADPTKAISLNDDRTSRDLTPGETMPTTTTTPAATRQSGELHRAEGEHDHSHHEEDEEDDAVAAIPADIANTAGDTCAICIDNLEDTDDVRGLTCGHAFHTACLDPWLTSRRACCPLCKADYYVPKPRSDAEVEAEEAARERRRQQAAELHRHPLSAWWYRAEAYLMPPVANNSSTNGRRARHDARRRSAGTTSQYNGSRWNPFSRPNNSTDASATNNSPEIVPAQRGNFLSRLGRRTSDALAPPSNTAEPTPSSLEAGLNPIVGGNRQL